MTGEFLGRRAADVDVLRLEGTVESHGHKIDQMMREGCAHRDDEGRRIAALELAQGRTFSLLEEDRRNAAQFRESVLVTIGEIRTDITKGMSEVRIWILAGVLFVMLGVAGWLVDKFVFPSIAPGHGHATTTQGG